MGDKCATLSLNGPALYYIGDDETVYRLDLARPAKSKIDNRQRAIADALLKVADDNISTVHFEIVRDKELPF